MRAQQGKGLAILVLVLLSWVSQGVVIRSTMLNTIETRSPSGETKQWNQRTATLEFHENDNFDSSLKIGDLHYVFSAERPAISYTADLQGFVPERVKIYTSEVILTDAKARTGVNVTDLSSDGPNAHTLMSTIDNKTGRRLMSIIAFGVGAVVGLAVGGLFGGGGRNYDDAFNKINLQMEAHANQIMALQDYNNAMEVWKDEVVEWMQEQEQVNSDVKSILNDYAGMFENLEGSVHDLHSALGELAKHADEQDRKTQGYIREVWLGVGQATQVMEQYTNTQIEHLWNVIHPILNNMSTSVESVAQAEQHNRRILSKRVRDALRNIRKTAELIRMTQLRTAVVREMSPLIHYQLAKARADGFEPFLQTGGMGTAPSPVVSTDARKVFIDRMWINRIKNGDWPQLSSVNVVLYCNYEAISASMIYEPAYEDFFEMLGPTNCTRQPGETVNNCRCWLEVQEDKCNSKPNFLGTGRHFFWHRLEGDLFPEYYRARPEYCETSVVTKGPMKTVDNVVEWHKLLGAMSCEQLYTYDPVYDNKIQLVSERIGKIAIPWSNHPNVCKFDFDMLFESGEHGNTLPFTLYHSWLRAFKILMSSSQKFEVERYGAMPNYLTCKENPFKTLANGIPYPSWTCSFLGVSTTTVPVYSLTPDSSSTVISMRSFHGPPECAAQNINSCFSDEGMESDHVFDVQATSEGPLPLAADVIIGNLNGLSTEFYDLQRGSTPLAPPPTARAGTLTYLLQSIPDGQTQQYAAMNPPRTQTLEEWIAYNGGMDMDATMGAFSIDMLQREIRSGVCAPESCKTKGWVASLLDDYEIDRIATDLPAGRFVLRAKRYRGSGTVDIVDGEIVRRVDEGCPEIDFINYANNNIELTLKNSLPQAIQLVYSVVSDKPYCVDTGDTHMLLSPKQTYIKRLERCGEQLFTVSRIGANGVRTPCGGVYNITVAMGSGSNVDPFVLGGFNQTVVVNSVIAAAVDISRDVVALMNAILPFMNPVKPPTITGDEWRLLVTDIITNFTNHVNNKAAAVDLTSDSAYGRVEVYLDGVTDKMTQFNQTFKQTKQTLVHLEDKLVEQSETLRRVEEASTAAEAALNASNAANAELIRRIRDAQAAINKITGQCCGGFLCEFLFCPLLGFFKNLLAYAVLAIVSGIIFVVVKKLWEKYQEKRRYDKIQEEAVQAARIAATSGRRMPGFREMMPRALDEDEF